MSALQGRLGEPRRGQLGARGARAFDCAGRERWQRWHRSSATVAVAGAEVSAISGKRQGVAAVARERAVAAAAAAVAVGPRPQPSSSTHSRGISLLFFSNDG